MKVNEILSNGKITLSFEVFPPKTDAQFESVRQATIDVAALKPSYIWSRRKYKKEYCCNCKRDSGHNWRNNDCTLNMCRRNKGKYS